MLLFCRLISNRILIVYTILCYDNFMTYIIMTHSAIQFEDLHQCQFKIINSNHYSGYIHIFVFYYYPT